MPHVTIYTCHMTSRDINMSSSKSQSYSKSSPSVKASARRSKPQKAKAKKSVITKDQSGNLHKITKSAHGEILDIKPWKPSKDESKSNSIFLKPSSYTSILSKGTRYIELKKLSSYTSFSDRRILLSLGVSDSTIARRKKENRLEGSDCDRLFRFAEIFKLSVSVFGTKERAKEWLESKHNYLNNNTALDNMQTETGASEVENLLYAIDHGIYL